MASRPKSMPCLARLKAMDIQPGQNEKARQLPFHAFAKSVCPVKVPEDQSQAHPLAGNLLWIYTHRNRGLVVLGRDLSMIHNARYRCLPLRHMDASLSIPSHRSCRPQVRKYA